MNRKSLISECLKIVKITPFSVLLISNDKFTEHMNFVNKIESQIHVFSVSYCLPWPDQNCYLTSLSYQINQKITNKTDKK